MFRPEKIPALVWEDTDYFGLSISPVAQELLEISTDELLPKMMSLQKDLDQYHLRDVQCCWLAIAYGHPDLSHELLMRMSGLLRLSPSDSLLLAATFGNKSYFEKLTQDISTSLKKLVEEYVVDRAIGKAIRHKHPHLIPLLEGVVSHWPVLRSGPICMPHFSSSEEEIEFAIALRDHGVFSGQREGAHLPTADCDHTVNVLDM